MKTNNTIYVTSPQRDCYRRYASRSVISRVGKSELNIGLYSLAANGSAYRSHAFRRHLAAAGLRHIRTRPYTPRTNGKAERFIQTSLREWAYARPYHSSAERTNAMQPWITDYNQRRPHSALGGKSPAERLNNVLGFDT